MITIIQRVTQASVRVDNKMIADIRQGILALEVQMKHRLLQR